MKISKFDKKNLQALRIEMQALLEKYGAQTNLEIKVGNMSFSDAEVNIKVKATVIGAETFDDAILKTTAAAAISSCVITVGHTKCHGFISVAKRAKCSNVISLVQSVGSHGLQPKKLRTAYFPERENKCLQPWLTAVYYN